MTAGSAAGQRPVIGKVERSAMVVPTGKVVTLSTFSKKQYIHQILMQTIGGSGAANWGM